MSCSPEWLPAEWVCECDMLLAAVVWLGVLVSELSNGLDDVGVMGVTGLVGWLEESGFSSLVRFFLRKPKLGIDGEVGEWTERAGWRWSGERPGSRGRARR